MIVIQKEEEEEMDGDNNNDDDDESVRGPDLWWAQRRDGKRRHGSVAF